MTTESRFYSVKEFAEQTGLCTDTVYERIRRHEIPTVKFGKRPLIPREWLDGQITKAINTVRVGRR